MILVQVNYMANEVLIFVLLIEPISLNQMSQSIDKTKGMYSTSVILKSCYLGKE
jgi:hypothetical protein